ncbi:U-box domain-containing protein [Salix suchowensis]|uniref:RING-type E3 ubiquitin transferase n=1 Tax=Salix koriyanagi TaxID=2511006 RepID=A0A9Q0VZ88_9ROSI|nr:U-box domain-containing protein [Salix suchowensis]KAJ6757449.1 U-BOX DOMAIN-CONTAINING PROTEIN 9 [Salix koriyanagi]
MAEAGILETIPRTIMTKETELRKELEKLVKTILVEEDCTVEAIDEAMRILRVLKELKIKKSLKVVDDTAIPEEFRCPISTKIMSDPVVLATGQTYDRPFIQRWLNEGHRTCPKTQQVISHTILTPNHLVQEMISKWCYERGIELPKPLVDEDVHAGADRGYLKSLLEKMSSSLSDQKEAAKELRLLTKRMPSFRAFFSDTSDAIPKLLDPLSRGRANTHPDLQENLITTIFNLSIHEDNKQLLAENPHAIPLLVESVRFGTTETRSNAAAALFSLSTLDSNKLIIGKSGALRPLIDLLKEGHPLAMKDAASAIFNLCLVLENKCRAVREGAVRVILKKIMDSILVDELLATLVILASQPKAVEEMGMLGAVPCLLGIMRESSSERNKENCSAILHTICLNDRTKWPLVMEEEKANATLSILAEHGTSRAKRKAGGILQMIKRGASITFR